MKIHIQGLGQGLVPLVQWMTVGQVITIFPSGPPQYQPSNWPHSTMSCHFWIQAMYDDNQYCVSHHLLVLEYVQMFETLASMQSANECHI